MTTFVVSGARALGTALVQTAGQVALSYANSAISSAFDNRRIDGPQLNQFHLLTSRDGAPMARTFGRVRLAGQVIWASRLNEIKSETQTGGKGGGPTRTDYRYTISFAIGLCEGVIQSVDRIWVNGAPLSLTDLTMRVYNGTDDQDMDPVIQAVEGPTAPAFLGTAYIVFEDFPLDDFGARLPQVNVEVTRLPKNSQSGPRLETQVQAVHLLPSSGEFAYGTTIVEDISNPGAAKPVNMNNLSGQADMTLALDQLRTALPACRNVSLVISWFGTDLRVGSCTIRPGVETDTRLLGDAAAWQVNGLTRSDAYLVSQTRGEDGIDRPNYGGTPSDGTIIETIKTLKARGYGVTIYPFILMDIASGNGLPDPYGGSEQARFPWRGRISCSPAPNRPGSPDGTNGITADVAAFFGDASPSDFGVTAGQVSYQGVEEFSFRRFILHYAKIAALAGGVDSFIIGSEMRGLTTLRSGQNSYPAVDALRSLARDVRTMLPNSAISYAADWTEYFGHHPQDGSGDVNFHLDSLWADEAVDAVAIDAYFPLSDWREGDSHADADLAPNIYDLGYLKSNIEGGEGYDWYYASRADRDAQIRTPITDGAHNKPWVYRYKDIRNWWGQPHIPRIAGIEVGAPTAWQPRSKPIWLMEIGCPAVDKGANQPNVFYDPKSSESFLPYHSAGERDDLIQRRYLEAMTAYWDPSAEASQNPPSAHYDGPMIDMSKAHVWCWDARPYPDFPARDSVWADGPNWQLGHWLTGRMGLVSVADVVYDIVSEAGLSGVDTSKIPGLLDGYTLDRPMSARAALGPLSLVYGFDMVERAEGLSFVAHINAAPINLKASDIAASAQDGVSVTKADPEAQLRDVRLHFVDGTRDYQNAAVSARRDGAPTVRVLDIQAPLVMDASMARFTAARLLRRSVTLDRQIDFTLSPSRLDIEVGDVLNLPGEVGVWQVTDKDGPGAARIKAQAFADAGTVRPPSGLTPQVSTTPLWTPKPVVIALDIPTVDNRARRGLLVGAYAQPFNAAAISAGGEAVTVTEPVKVGALLSDLPRGPVHIWDRHAGFDLLMPGLQLSSVDDAQALSGANRFAVETDTGWEILSARDIQLTDTQQYRCSHLLRGLSGTDADMMDSILAGARVVWLGQGLVDLPLEDARIGEDVTLSSIMAGRAGDDIDVPYKARHLRPLSPVHGRLISEAGGLGISWIRRTREGGDSWTGLDVPLGEEAALYRVTIRGQGLRRTVETAATSLLMSDITMDSVRTVSIAQGSRAYGFGPPLTLTL